ncbi:hypothetical protein [Salmonella phage vB_SalS_TU03]|nr:hypothetical protein [Salmonella phage vB_SalS_TU03]
MPRGKRLPDEGQGTRIERNSNGAGPSRKYLHGKRY